MNKIIILPEKNTNGFFIKNNIYNKNLCDILLSKNIKIEHSCEKLGVCNTCKIFFHEGYNLVNKINFKEIVNFEKYFINNSNYRLSCQTYITNKSNIIISL